VKLVFASHNQGKVNEAKVILAGVDFQILSLNDCEITEEVEETGQTFADNALLKAQFYAQLCDANTVADDSGLEIMALNGWPGVNSARFISGTDADRVKAVLKKMVGHQDRRAQFKTVICLVMKDRPPQFFEGVIKGQLAQQPTGTNGFGYDPIFIPDGYDQPFAQLGMAVKNKISHRQQALEKLKAYLLAL